MNPCPCGWLGAPAALGRPCRCSPDAVARYQGRLSGPLLDRIDLQVEVPAVPPSQMLAAADGESSAAVAARVAAARERALQRQGRPNALLPAAEVERVAAASSATLAFLRQAAQRLGWTGRGLHRSLRVARTLADLAGAAQVDLPHVAEALQFRRGVIGGLSGGMSGPGSAAGGAQG
jgi:magnesium chelatase family protein